MYTEQAARTADQVASLPLRADADLAEPARVRAWARAKLPDLAEEELADTILVLDELVSNALRHGKPPRRVRLVWLPGRLLVEVDDSARTPAVPRPPTDHGGRGLALIEACSSAWGQEVRHDGKTVWAELARRSPFQSGNDGYPEAPDHNERRPDERQGREQGGRTQG